MLPIKTNLTDNFLEEETRNGFIVSEQTKKIWAVEIDLLLEFDRICNENGLTYYLDSGSLLGAVREHGFIPWDDDIDVIMFRSDYEKLIKNGEKWFEEPYFLQSSYSDINYFRPHAQLRNSNTTGMLSYEGVKVPFNQGIFIDIFVLDGLTQDSIKLKKQIKKINKFKKLYNYIWMPYSDNPHKQRIKKVLSAILSLRYVDAAELFKKFDEEMQRYEEEPFVDKTGLRVDTKELYYLDRTWFGQPKKLEFEGYQVPVPNDYDKVLTAYYGKDYMEPKAIPTLHGEVIFDAEKSYLETIESMKNKEE